MIVSLAEAKEYLRIDTDYEDTLIEGLLRAAQNLCANVARLDEKVFEISGEVAKMSVLYTIGYLYENRADADMHKLTMTLRSLLFPIRQYDFAGSTKNTETSTDANLTFAMFDSNGNLIDSGFGIASDEEVDAMLKDTGLDGDTNAG